MDENRKNSLERILLFALLVLTVWQGVQLRDLNDDLDRMRDRNERQMEVLSDRVHSSEGRLSAEIKALGDPIADYALSPAGVDKDSRTLLANLSVTLKEVRTDTQVTLNLQAEGDAPQIVALARMEDGSFRTDQPAGLPLDTEAVTLSATVESGGASKTQELTAAEPHLLLPLRLSGTGWSRTYQFSANTLQIIDNLSASIETQDYQLANVREGRFHVYRNEEEVFSSEAQDSQGGSYAPVEWQDLFEADKGDVFRITFTCRDEYGLGYEFTLQEVHISESGALSEPATLESSPRLFW